MKTTSFKGKIKFFKGNTECKKIQNRAMIAACQAVYLKTMDKLDAELTNSEGRKSELAKGAGKGSRSAGLRINWPDAQNRWCISMVTKAVAWSGPVRDLVQPTFFADSEPKLVKVFEELLLLEGGGMFITNAKVGNPSLAKTKSWPPR